MSEMSRVGKGNIPQKTFSFPSEVMVYCVLKMIERIKAVSGTYRASMISDSRTVKNPVTMNMINTGPKIHQLMPLFILKFAPGIMA
jgi:hypothetical protein